MDSRPLISVVVPVYNVVEYLEECVSSLTNQSFGDIEIILVDDGSTDGSSTMCDDLEKSDERIRVIHKENGGLSDARNTGIRFATGEYLSFIDSDDWLSLNAFECCVPYLNDSDIVVFGIVKEIGGVVVKELKPRTTAYLSNAQALEQLNCFGGIDVSACNKIYRKTLFNDIVYPVGKYCEDCYTTFRIIDLASSIVTLPHSFYHYRMRDGSITHAVPFHEEFIEAALIQLDYFKCHHPELVDVAFGYCGFAYLTKLNCLIKYDADCNEIRKVHSELRKFNSSIQYCKSIPTIKRLQFAIASMFPSVYSFVFRRKAK